MARKHKTVPVAKNSQAPQCASFKPFPFLTFRSFDEGSEYAFNDMPKRFQRMIVPKKPVKRDSAPAKPTERPSKKVDESSVRPGESFRQYNERLGLSVRSTNDVGTGKNFKQKIAEEFAEARGIRSKRKEHLKRRDAKKKGVKRDEDDSELEDLVTMESHRFGEQVAAPPVLKVAPRNAPKSTLKFKRK